MWVESVGWRQEPDLRFEDNLDSEFDLADLFEPDAGGLHSPYLAEAEFEIWIWDDNDVTNFKGWEVRSSDPEVVEVLDTRRKSYSRGDDEKEVVLIARVRAGEPGTAEVAAYGRTTDRVGGAGIQVGEANGLELRAAGPLFIERKVSRWMWERPRC